MIRLKRQLLAPLLMLATIFSTAAPPVALTTLVITQTACPKRAELADYGQDIVSALNDTLPIFENGGIATGKLRQAISLAAQLTVAFRDHQDASAVELTAAMITAFEGIASDVAVIPDPAMRTRVLIGLGLANVALHYISNHLVSAAPAGIAHRTPGRSSPADTILDFNDKKQWRCRNSQNGQFAKMEFCKAHPDVSVVETY